MVTAMTEECWVCERINRGDPSLLPGSVLSYQGWLRYHDEQGHNPHRYLNAEGHELIEQAERTIDRTILFGDGGTDDDGKS